MFFFSLLDLFLEGLIFFVRVVSGIDWEGIVSELAVTIGTEGDIPSNMFVDVEVEPPKIEILGFESNVNMLLETTVELTELFSNMLELVSVLFVPENIPPWTSVATGSEFPVPGRFRVLQSRVRAGYGYTLKFETRVPGTLRVIGG